MIDNELFQKYSPALYDTGKKLADKYREKIKEADAVAQGRLLNFKWDIKRAVDSLELVFYLPYYWYWIEYGRKRTVNKGDGTVKEKIKEWMSVKGISDVMVSNGNRRKGDKKGVPIMKSDIITYFIHKRGYQARNPLYDAMMGNRSLRQEFANNATKIIMGDVKDAFVQINNIKK